jgi:hypothetical protein
VPGARHEWHFDDENGPVYRLQSRGGKGVITMKTGDKTGDVIGR